MTLSGLLLFCTAYGLAVASPGPGIAALVARVLARGPKGIWLFILGFVVGDLIWFAIAAGGLTMLARSMDGVFVALRYAGAVYLLYVAWKLWTAPATVDSDPAAPAPPAERGHRLFLGGLTVCLGNPKVIVFFTALLPTVVDLPSLTLSGALILVGCIIAMVSAIIGGYALAAARARRLFRSSRAMRVVNRGTGAVMAGAAVAVATR